jgi:hypothetical protein
MKIATFQGPVVFGDAEANLATTASALYEQYRQMFARHENVPLGKS